MPSPVGHALAGVAVALAANRAPQPPIIRRFLTDPITLWAVALAALPDADLLLRGFHRTVTHSVFTTIAVTIVAMLVTGRVTTSGPANRLRQGDGGPPKRSAKAEAGRHHWRIAWGIVLTCGAAHASHIVLDWLGGDRSQPAGIQALWPVSHRWFISGWELFPQIERRQPFSAGSMAINLYALMWELLLMGPVIAGLWWARTRPRRSPQNPQRSQNRI